MTKHFRALIGLVLLLGLCCAAPGCALFGGQEPQEPRTVTEWLSQSRVEP